MERTVNQWKAFDSIGVSQYSHLDGTKDERERFVALLEIPPVDSAQRAVQVQFVKDAKRTRNETQ